MSDSPPPLEEHHLGKLTRLEREVESLKDMVDVLRLAGEEDGTRIVRIPNPEGAVDKIVVKYWAGNLKQGRYGEYTPGNFPLDTWRRLPAMPIEYQIQPGSDAAIVVRFKLSPGFCYRIVYRTHMADQWDDIKSLGFFEVGKSPT